MHYMMSYQICRYERGLSAAEQRAEDIRRGEAAAALRDLRYQFAAALRRGRRAWLAREAAAATTNGGAPALARVLSAAR